MTNNDTVSALYLFASEGAVHGAPALFNSQSACGIPTGKMVDLLTPAQAAYFGATPNRTAESIDGSVCSICFPA